MKKTSVKINILMNFMLTISNLIFPLITFPYVSRILLPVGTGKVAFATSMVSYFAMIGMLGIPTYGIRATARVREDKDKLSQTVQEIMVINTIAMTISLIGYLLAIVLVPRMAADRTLFMINIATLVFNLMGCEWLYKGLEQYSYITVRSILFKLVGLVLMFLFVHERSDYVLYGAITILASVGSNLLNLINLRRYITLKPYANNNYRQHLKPIFSFFMMTVATTIYTNLDAVMLGFMKGDEAVGYYNAAVKIKGILVSLVTSMGAVLLPRLSFYIKEGRTDEFKDLTIRSLQFVLFIGLPLWSYFTLFAKEGIYFLSGNAYTGAIIPMQVIMPTLFLIGVSNLLGIQILVPMGKENKVLESVALGAVVNIVFNLFFIPEYGATGASLGTLLAETSVTLYQIYVLRDFLKGILPAIKGYKVLLVTIFASLLTYASYRLFLQDLSDFLTLAVTAVIFGVAYFLCALVIKEEFTNYLYRYYRK